jgi:hypothetical protein
MLTFLDIKFPLILQNIRTGDSILFTILHFLQNFHDCLLQDDDKQLNNDAGESHTGESQSSLLTQVPQLPKTPTLPKPVTDVSPQIVDVSAPQHGLVA